MDPRYQEFCQADREFYDTPGHGRTAADLFDVHRRQLPPEWWRACPQGWRSYAPRDTSLPAQGWKIHVSATPADAERTAGTVWEYCLAERLPFKVTTGPLEFLLKNSKYADRSASGKLATIYPAGELTLARVLDELGELLHGQEGPYILSDLRWREGPLYVRYGAFRQRSVVDERGRAVPAVETPEGGLVPDPRGPVFRTPAWVTVPAFLQPELDRRAGLTLDSFPYEIVRALHFSNGGGVYEARERATGRRLVIKEARHHAGLDAAGQDAVTRLRHEQDMLTRLRALDCVPKVVAHLALGESEFLVEEFIDGTVVSDLYADRNPLSTASADAGRIADYRDLVDRVCAAVERAVRAVHGHGIVFGDLQPSNVIVCEEEGRPPRAVLVDFEVAWPVELPRRLTLATPGFSAPTAVEGFAVDTYALAALRLALLAPLTTLVPLDPGKAADLARQATDAFALPSMALDEVVTTLTAHAPPAGVPADDGARIALDHDGWPTLRDSLAAAIADSATPTRDDRLFPGDIAQFTGAGGLDFAHGAAGVLWALGASGAPVPQDQIGWLTRRTRAAAAGLPPGFYDGAHGIAYVLRSLGRPAEALALLEQHTRVDPDALDSGLYSGLSGIALALLDFAARGHGDHFHDRGLALASVVRDRVLARARRAEPPSRATPAGLLRGASGPALLMTRLYESEGDPSWLDAAATALRLDLQRCVTIADGALEVDEGWRVNPYLHSGSTGIGLVLQRWLRHRTEPDLAAALHGAGLAAQVNYYVFPGLLEGRAGMVLFHAMDPGRDPGVRERLAAQVDGLTWHQLRRRGRIAFPGNQLLRLSMDLATGGAGILLALAAAHGTPADSGVSLPFLL
ncbi:class III lanthionine synthetase LanKC [Streptomyces sp. NPDC057638]|uniref:class III lanthionine synthetase LanKC n=1 Tax=Streptomyces sp. NPDC057638 TaxID=3346190 RepID=UPI0036A08F36